MDHNERKARAVGSGKQANRRSRKDAARRRLLRRAGMFFSGICLLAAIGALIVFFNLQQQEARERRVFEELQQKFAEAIAGPTVQPEKTKFSLFPVASAETLPQTEQSGERVISDWAGGFYADNNDFVGWLTAGKDISVPVVFRDNEYYLTHDFYGNDSLSGTVFIDEENTDWLNNQYVLLYGHNMREGMIFGELDNYEEAEYFRENAEVIFHLLYDNEVRQYVPFAVVDCSVNRKHALYFKLRRFDIFAGETRDEQQILAFFDEIRSRSLISIPEIDLSVEDRVIGLVTCSYHHSDSRMIVYCREVREDEAAEELIELIRVNAAAQ